MKSIGIYTSCQLSKWGILRQSFPGIIPSTFVKGNVLLAKVIYNFQTRWLVDLQTIPAQHQISCYNNLTTARERSGCNHKQACTSGPVNSCGLKLIGGHIPHPREESTLWEFKITFLSEHGLCTQSTYCYCVQVHAHTITQSNNAPATSMAQAMSAHCPLYLRVCKFTLQTSECLVPRCTGLNLRTAQ